jgi:hypothetical protein
MVVDEASTRIPAVCMDAGLMTITALKTQIWTFGAPVAGASNSRPGTLVSRCSPLGGVQPGCPVRSG